MTQLGLFTQSETDQASSQPDTPANPLVKPGSAEAVKMTDTSGQKYFPLFSKSDQIGSFVKTFLDTSLWASTRCFLTWQTKPITQSKHFILELYPSTPHTEECDSGSSQEIWATPNTMDSLPSRSYEAMMRQATTGGRKNRRRPGNLREQIDPLMQQAYDEARAKANNQEFKREIEPKMWATPTTQEIEHPNAELTESGRRLSKDKKSSHSLNLADQVKMWPTPTTKGYGHASEGQVANLLKKVQDGTITMKEAEQMVGLQTLENHRTYKKMWPTPNASDSKQANMKDGHDIKKGYLRGVVKMYPTPTASLEKHSTKEAYWENRIQKGRQEDIQMRVYKETGSGSLNPQWVEWLMGYPEGWTDLKD